MNLVICVLVGMCLCWCIFIGSNNSSATWVYVLVVDFVCNPVLLLLSNLSIRIAQYNMVEDFNLTCTMHVGQIYLEEMFSVYWYWLVQIILLQMKYVCCHNNYLYSKGWSQFWIVYFKMYLMRRNQIWMFSETIYYFIKLTQIKEIQYNSASTGLSTGI